MPVIHSWSVSVLSSYDGPVLTEPHTRGEVSPQQMFWLEFLQDREGWLVKLGTEIFLDKAEQFQCSVPNKHYNQCDYISDLHIYLIMSGSMAGSIH